jgi:hypothetical protein
MKPFEKFPLILLIYKQTHRWSTREQ